MPENRPPAKFDLRPGDLQFERGRWDLTYRDDDGDDVLVSDLAGLRKHFEQNGTDPEQGMRALLTDPKLLHAPASLLDELDRAIG